MTTASITKSQAKKLYDFCVEHECKEFFFAKDHGAYFAATTRSSEDNTFKNSIQYLKGCNPDSDEDYYEEARHKFGGDDFGDHLPTTWLKVFFTEKRFEKKRMFSVRFNKNSILLAE